MATTPSLELVGRSRELARLDDFVGQLREGPRAVLIRGEPGIGKTVLWREAVTASKREDFRVLVARCAESEMPISFGALADLVDPVYEEVAEAIAEPQRRALAAALRVEGDERERPDRLALPRALVATLQALAAEGPVLVAVDDVQWLDAPSARALAYAVRRVGSSPIGVLTTLRGGAEDPDPLRLADAFDSGFAELVLGPLSVSALQRLVRERFDVRIPRSKLATVHAASGGNPMFALEFARAVEREDVDLRARLPVPSSLDDLVRDRVRSLPESTRPLTELASAVERPTPVLLVKAFGENSAEALIDQAVSAGAMAVGADGVVRFTHPLLGSAVYFGMPTQRRRALHLEVAGLVDDLEQQARHLALGTPEPDEAVADLVEQAARAAARRGAPDAAATLAAEAVRLTPPDDEPSRARRTFVVAGFLMEAGDVAEAGARIRPFLDPSVPAVIRSQALVTRAETEHTNRLNLQTYLREAIDIAPDPHVRWVAWMRYAQMGGWISADAQTATECARKALDIAIELADPGRLAASTAALAFYESARGNRDISFDEAELAAFGEAELAASEQLRPAPWQITPALSVGARLLWAGELDRAREVLRDEYDRLVRQGSVLRLPLNLMSTLSDVEWRAGRLAAADAYANDARAILEDAMPGGAHVVGYAQVVAAGSLGRVEEARTLAATDLQTSVRYQDLNQLRIPWALGHVELAGGNPAAAWQTLEGLPEALDEFGIKEPGWQPILPDVVETLVALGRLDEAEAVLQRLEAQAVALEHRWATPAAQRCRASLLLAREQADEAGAAAEEAAAAFAGIGFPLDRGRALLTAGAARRRAGQRRLAADSLKASIEIFEELGAVLWRERAEEELRRASPRPRRDRELTSAERRVAALVAEGHTNREVAAQLFTSVATVEAHLTRIYRKLGIRSRTQLTRAVAEGTLDLSAP